MKATIEQQFHVALLIILDKVVLSFKSVDKPVDQLNESSKVILSCDHLAF